MISLFMFINVQVRPTSLLGPSALPYEFIKFLELPISVFFWKCVKINVMLFKY